MQDDKVEGYLVFGQNPAVGSAHGKLQRLAMAHLKWLVVRDVNMIETATFWKDSPEIATGELRTEDIDTEVFFFPAAAHTEKDGTFTNTNRMLQWHHTAVEPAGEQRSDLWFVYHLGRIIREKLAALEDSDDVDRPIRDLAWDYPTHGPLDEPSAEAVLQEINGRDATGKLLSAYTELKADGSTSSGCWIYCGVYADGVNQSARRTPVTDGNWLGPEWGWAWPANRRVLYNRASAAPDGTPWSARKALVWWDAEAKKWTGDDVPDFVPDKDPGYVAGPDDRGAEGLNGTDPFIMQSDGRGWLYAPAGVIDGPLPTHYEPQDSPVRNPLYRIGRSPVREVNSRPNNRFHPSGDEPGADSYPFVVTTYRLTEHFTAGGMSRWTPYLAELQPELFCEISPSLARLRSLEHGGWATVVTARGVIETRVLVTERMKPLTIQGKTVHQIGLPYHWGQNGHATGDAVNELTSIALDPNAHIEEVKALTADIVPGRRPQGPARAEYVRLRAREAGITEKTGMGN
jgi:formate dehydrogenase major subunit